MVYTWALESPSIWLVESNPWTLSSTLQLSASSDNPLAINDQGRSGSPNQDIVATPRGRACQLAEHAPLPETISSPVPARYFIRQPFVAGARGVWHGTSQLLSNPGALFYLWYQMKTDAAPPACPRVLDTSPHRSPCSRGNRPGDDYVPLLWTSVISILIGVRWSLTDRLFGFLPLSVGSRFCGPWNKWMRVTTLYWVSIWLNCSFTDNQGLLL